MARGVAKTLEERVSEIETKKAEYQAKIDNYRERISELDKQVKDVEDVQQQEKVAKLLDAIVKSGKTVEEVLAAVGTSPADE